jgi:antirestriction protein ArdC
MEGYSSPYWLTYNQARELGGHVRKGEKGMAVLLWKPSDRKGSGEGEQAPADGNDRRRLYVTTYTVFNLDQTEGVQVPARLTRPVPQVDPIESAERIVASYAKGPTIVHGGDRACYFPSADRVNVPHAGAFHSREHYYSVLFHELTHSTGHESRLARDLGGMGDAYAQEELIAELGAAFLTNAAGIENPATLEDSSSYLRFWLGKFRDDKGQSLVKAASAAQRAADLILGTFAAEQAESEAA